MLEQPAKTHLPSVAQLVISLTGLALAFLFAIVVWVITRLNGSTPDQANQQVSSLIWIGLIISLVSIPSIFLSIKRLSGKSMESPVPRHQFLVVSLIGLLIIPIVFLCRLEPALLRSTPLMVVLSVIVVAIPLWWFVEFGRKQLNVSKPQRFWGLINFEVFVTMPLVLFIELVVIVLALIVGGLWIIQQPEFKSLMMTLQIQTLTNPEQIPALLEKINPLFQKPDLLAAGMFLMVVLTPLIEEIFKPLSLWFFIKQEWSPAEGFTAGLICGAAFALVESVMSVASIPQDSWIISLIGRIGTGLLHTLTTGLTGWALVSSWRDGKYKRIGLIYLVSVMIHGTWNFLALLLGLGSSIQLLAGPALSVMITASPWILMLMFVGMLMILYLMNRKIRTSMIPLVIPALPVETMG